jgi:Mg2+-importing ATPase
LALAIGLTPQLLPAIISVNLAHGAKRMALQKVIVRRLTSIENLGSMNILCSDKTGTLTKGLVELKSALGVDGNINEKVQLYASINAFYETGFTNPIDEAIRRQNRFNLSDYHKLDEVPYDFVRKRLSILVSNKYKRLIITKGALKNVLEICSDCEISPEKIVDLDTIRTNIRLQFERLSSDGFRILGIAYRDVGAQEKISKCDEINMTFLGILVFFDPIKTGILDSISILKQLGVSLKVITGDNSLVATYLAKQLNLNYSQILTGPEISKLSTESLIRVVNDVDIFAEVEPNQKEQIILALKKSRITVGYI